MFRRVQSYRGSAGHPVVTSESRTLETGEIVEESKDLCKTKLPKADLFDLEQNIKANVNLEEVNSKILSGKVDGDKVMNKYFKKEETEPNTEVNNNENE